MYKSDTIPIKTDTSYSLTDIALKLWSKYMPPRTECLFDFGRDSTGFPYVSYMTPDRGLYFHVSGNVKVRDHKEVLAWKGNSFTIELGSIEKDRLRTIVEELAKEL